MAEGQKVAVEPRASFVGGQIEVEVRAGDPVVALSFEHAVKLQDDLGGALLESASDSRWKCPKCGSTHVQVSLPTWYRETSEGTLIMVTTDGEADVQFWYCEECEESDSGEPERA
jgi:hypothetical protein